MDLVAWIYLFLAGNSRVPSRNLYELQSFVNWWFFCVEQLYKAENVALRMNQSLYTHKNLVIQPRVDIYVLITRELIKRNKNLYRVSKWLYKP